MSYDEGILLVDKPSGMTSHDIVAFIRKRYGFKKVGHAGTLDPMATGLLIILLGRFTKNSLHFSNQDKEYEARLCLGISTDTGDREGSILEKKEIKSDKKNIEKITEILNSFQGKISQVPPMYSAKKIKGKKLYELARKGLVLKREPKEILIEKIKILDISIPYITFYLKCSKGTYVRQLVHDIGEKIGCGAHLAALRRTRIGPFRIEDALSFERLEDETLSINENILQP